MWAVLKGKDVDEHDICVEWQDICGTWVQESRLPTLQNNTRAKYFGIVSRRFLSYLSMSQAISRERRAVLDIGAMKDLLQAHREEILADHTHQSQFVPISRRRERALIPWSAFAKFRASPFVVNWLELGQKLVECDACLIADMFSDPLFESYVPLPGSSLKLRNLLMTIMVISTVRRSKEIMSLPISSVADHRRVDLECGAAYELEPVTHKTERYLSVHILLNQREWDLLQVYLRFYRPLICSQPPRRQSLVFPVLTPTGDERMLSYAGFCKAIHHAFVDLAGVSVPARFGTRNVRRSAVTHSRRGQVPLEDQRLLARVMGHSLSTADLFYDSDVSTRTREVMRCLGALDQSSDVETTSSAAPALLAEAEGDGLELEDSDEESEEELMLE